MPAKRPDGWQAAVSEQAFLARERERARGRPWVVRMLDPPLVSRVWALRWDRQGGGDVAEDLSLMSTCYEWRVMASFRTCEDGVHVLCELDPPLESLRVRPEHMTGVTQALRRSGVSFEAVAPDGRRYAF